MKLKHIFLIMISFSFAFIILINIGVSTFGNSIINPGEDALVGIDTALILGASVYGDEMSAILKDRADTALSLYEKGIVKNFLISGDNYSLYYDEVSVVEEYLIENGVREGNIKTDDYGLDTFDSLYRAKEVFHKDKLIIVTQRFHLKRALYIARSLGIEAYGVTANMRPYKNEKYFMLREVFANVKAFFDITLKSKPEFL